MPLYLNNFNSQLHPVPASPSRIRKLTLIIATVTILSACGAVQNPQDEAIASPDPLPNSTRSINNRATATRVLIDSDIVAGDNDVIAYSDIWERVGAGLQFSADVDDARIDQQIAFYKENPRYILEVTERSGPFIYSIVEELQKRDMPLEFALLPIVESAYNPNASARDTVGLWQILNATGHSLGLKQDWWYDGRRDPIASTSAALDYLQTLYTLFDNDWLLALAAYNSGQGTVQKAVEVNRDKSRGIDYWSLNLPPVTEEYVPKLIALSRLIAAPEHYGLELAQISDEPVVEAVDVGSQIDLDLAANIAGMEPETLYQLNPGFRQWATHPDGPYTLLLPVTHVTQFTEAVAKLKTQDRVTWDRYVVQPGDSLSKIANKFRTQVSALQQANDIKGSRIVAGESLLIPRAYNSTTPLVTPNAPEYASVAFGSTATLTQAPAPARYEVRSGDSLWAIAHKFNLGSETLAKLNNIPIGAVLRPGQVLVLQTEPVLAQSAREDANEQSVNYKVRAGDSLERIAQRFGVDVADLVAWNDINIKNLIHPGQQLVVRPDVSKLN